jgi:hypothetical protein
MIHEGLLPRCVSLSRPIYQASRISVSDKHLPSSGSGDWSRHALIACKAPPRPRIAWRRTSSSTIRPRALWAGPAATPCPPRSVGQCDASQVGVTKECENGRQRPSGSPSADPLRRVGRRSGRVIAKSEDVQRDLVTQGFVTSFGFQYNLRTLEGCGKRSDGRVGSPPLQR